jgi:hypothetical protein
MSLQFIACKAEDCPLNQDRQCRAPFIMVGPDGRCLMRDDHVPAGPKSATENYVDLRACQCSGCDFWERDEANQSGKCGFGADLAFAYDSSKALAGPYCLEFAGQVSRTGPSTTV